MGVPPRRPPESRARKGSAARPQMKAKMIQRSFPGGEAGQEIRYGFFVGFAGLVKHLAVAAPGQDDDFLQRILSVCVKFLCNRRRHAAVALDGDEQDGPVDYALDGFYHVEIRRPEVAAPADPIANLIG